MGRSKVASSSSGALAVSFQRMRRHRMLPSSTFAASISEGVDRVLTYMGIMYQYALTPPKI